MILKFFKYHGNGNDFIMIDNRKRNYDICSNLISKLCHRRFGIGADGLILLETSDQYDFKMRYFNSDGLEGSMCGNGGRCITLFARNLGLIKSEAIFEACDGEHKSIITSAGRDESVVKLKMSDVSRIEKKNGFFFINTGSPHHVVFVDNLKCFDVINEGKKIRDSSLYAPEGTNVDFVEIIDDQLFVRTFERGVEDETLSCGTGVTAAAIAFSLIKSGITLCNIETPGGHFKVCFEKNADKYSNIWLEGIASTVYEGKINTLNYIY